MNKLFRRVRGENKARFVANQGGDPATEATVGPSDKPEAGSLVRMVFERFRHEVTKAEPAWGAREWDGMAGKTVKDSVVRA